MAHQDDSDSGRVPALRGDLINPALESLPGLARVAASAAWHTTGWGLRTSARGWRRVGRALTSQQEAISLAQDAGQAVHVMGQLALSISSNASIANALMSAGASLGGESESPQQVAEQPVIKPRTPSTIKQVDLRDRGRELLERSRDVWSTEQGHPAFERILGELAPDEGRILMLMLTKGPQPTVDIRTGGPIGMVNSALIAPGLNMIGPRAGCRYVDSVPSYINNLSRLGLVWLSRESLTDPLEYQVVEAQPDVLAAMHSVKFAKVVRRSIHLTPFGEGFCKSCLIEEEKVDSDFPEHTAPPADGVVAPG